MATKNSIPLTADRLRELFYYNDEDGTFTRRIKTSNNALVGDIAGCLSSTGYLVIRINDVLYSVHRLAMLYMNGAFPINQVDHVDGNRRNNSWKNLRECHQFENCQNNGIRRNNASGFMGVSWDSQTSNWAAQIMHNRKTIRLGRFPTKESAYAAYLKAKSEIHTFNPSVRT